MKRPLEEKLKNTFPQLFIDMWGDPKVTCLAFGCDHGEGWYELLWTLCENIQKELNRHPEPDFKFTQVKQKFGRLIVYHTNSQNDAIYQLIDNAMEESVSICEQCGSTDLVSMLSQGYITPLCKRCRSL